MNRALLPLTTARHATDGEIDGITRFQKLVFLAQRECDGASPYGFDADDFGPFSQALYDDLYRLTDASLLDQTDVETEFGNTYTVYAITDKGERAVDKYDDDAFPVAEADIRCLHERFHDVGLWDLLEYVYTEYPRMARNSDLSLV